MDGSRVGQQQKQKRINWSLSHQVLAERNPPWTPSSPPQDTLYSHLGVSLQDTCLSGTERKLEKSHSQTGKLAKLHIERAGIPLFLLLLLLLLLFFFAFNYQTVTQKHV